MTKSQPSGTKKLPLARLFRWLAVLCFIKLSIFIMIFLDLPFPALLDKTADTIETANIQKANTTVISKNEQKNEPKPTEYVAPATLQLAPAQQTPPTPLRADEMLESDLSGVPLLQTPDFPLPDPLPAPLAEPGTIAVEEEKSKKHELPVPTLGKVTIALAADSMPVPQTIIPTQTMTPAEQHIGTNTQGLPNMPTPQAPQRQSFGGPTAPVQNPSASIPQNPLQMGTEAQELARQQQDMLVLKKQMDERIKELQDSEAKVKRMLLEARGLENQKIKTLIQMFGNMKPKTAAKALENMDEHTACKILEGLTPKQSGDILSYTKPAVTAKLTELLTHVKMK